MGHLQSEIRYRHCKYNNKECFDFVTPQLIMFFFIHGSRKFIISQKLFMLDNNFLFELRFWAYV